MHKFSPISLVLADGFTTSERVHTNRLLAHRLFGVGISGATGSGWRTVLKEDSAPDCPLVWAPDGKTLYVAGKQIVAVDVRAGTSRQITNFAQYSSILHCFSCSPDGKTFFFRQSVSDSKPSAATTYVFKSSGSQRNRLCCMSTDGSDYRVVWDRNDHFLISADIDWMSGRIVAAVLCNGGNTDYFVGSLAGNFRVVCTMKGVGHRVRIAQGGANFVGMGPHGVSLHSIPDEQSRVLNANGRYASWSPDGSNITYINHAYELMSVNVRTGSQISLVRLAGRNFASEYSASNYCPSPVWSPDGQLLLFCLTKTRRLRKPRDPQALETIRETDFYKTIPEYARPDYDKWVWDWQFRVEERLYGVVNFADRTVFTNPLLGMENAAWSPID